MRTPRTWARPEKGTVFWGYPFAKNDADCKAKPMFFLTFLGFFSKFEIVANEVDQFQ